MRSRTASWVVEVALGNIDRTLSGGLQRGPDAGEHVVERREVADLNVADVLGDLLDHAEHGPLTDRAVAALEGVVVRDALDRGLEQRELVADERVGPDEVGLVGVVAVGLGPVDEVEQRLEVGVLVRVDLAQCGRARVVLFEQALADDLIDVRAGELQARLEAGLDLGEVVALLPGAVADDLLHVLLRGHEHPRAARALGVERLGDGLQVEHQLGVRADELANLVDEEVQAEVRVILLVEPGLHLVGEVLDRDRVRGAVLLDDALGRPAVHLGEGTVDARAFQGALLAPLSPGDARDALERLLERVVLSAVVEVALEPGDVSLVAVVAAALVEDLDEHLEQGVGLVLADQGGLLVDVEQQALGRDAVCLVEQAGQEGVGALGPEAVGDVLARVVLAFDVP